MTSPEPVKRPLSRSDLQAHLAEQLELMELSAASFDAGFASEAKRLALGMRILLHNKGRSHSLLEQLGMRDQPFWDLAVPDEPGNRAPHGGLVGATLGGTSPPQCIALLDDVPFARQVPFAEWWGAQVFIDRRGASLSRADLVLTAADQDGGAHVDPSLDARYAAFARDNALGWEYVTGDARTPMDGAVRAAIRQVAHEVLKTLKEGYAKRRPPGDGVLMTGPAIQVVPQPPKAPKVGRNDRCPCGSGLKFKKCHGR